MYISQRIHRNEQSFPRLKTLDWKQRDFSCLKVHKMNLFTDFAYLSSLLLYALIYVYFSCDVCISYVLLQTNRTSAAWRLWNGNKEISSHFKVNKNSLVFDFWFLSSFLLYALVYIRFSKDSSPWLRSVKNGGIIWIVWRVRDKALPTLPLSWSSMGTALTLCKETESKRPYAIRSLWMLWRSNVRKANLIVACRF